MKKRNELDQDDVYTGVLGVAVAMLRASSVKEYETQLSYASDCVQEVSERHSIRPSASTTSRSKAIKRKRLAGFSWHTGEAGLHAVQAAVSHRMGDGETSEASCRELLSLASSLTDETPCEVLYGRAGYLQAILFVRGYLKDPTFGSSTVVKVIDQIISLGLRGAKRLKTKWPLHYQWHGEVYLGAAHGYAGIFFTLLQFVEELKLSKHRETVMELIGTTLTLLLVEHSDSGSVKPIADVLGKEHLVHWCHGAPGFIPLLLLAAKVFDGDQGKMYHKAALEMGEKVWEKGLLKKGMGLCHGISGNGMALLALHRDTKDLKWLQRARQFGYACVSFYQLLYDEPENPLSLFEGVAGVVCFLSDLLDPDHAFFPGYEAPLS